MPMTTSNMYAGGLTQPTMEELHQAASLAVPTPANDAVISLSKRDVDVLIRLQVKSIAHFGEGDGIQLSNPIRDKGDDLDIHNIHYLESTGKRIQELIDMRKRV